MKLNHYKARFSAVAVTVIILGLAVLLIAVILIFSLL